MSRIEGNCAKCGIYRWSLDKDHIIPKSKGGSDDPDNIQYLCQNCHSDKTIEDRKGRIASQEERNCQSLRMKEKFKDPEYRERHRNSQLGKKRSEETKLNISLGLLGKELTEEHKGNISEANRYALNSSPKMLQYQADRAARKLQRYIDKMNKL